MLTEISTPETFTEESFHAFHRRNVVTVPNWLQSLRQNGWRRFADVGFPSIKDEEWKYTNVAPLIKTHFDLRDADNTSSIDSASFYCAETENSSAVFVGNQFREDASKFGAVPDGVAIVDIVKAASDPKYSEVVRQHLGSVVDYVANPFTALNTAFLSSGGVLIYVPRDVKLETPLSLSFLPDASRKAPVAFSRVLIIAEQGSELTLIENYTSSSDATYFTNAVVEIVLHDNARVEHLKLQREGKEAFHVASTAVVLGPNSFYDTTAINMGAKLSRHDIRVTFAAEGAECRVDGLYLVTDDQHTDTHSVIDHAKPNCSSHQLYKGILDGRSRAVFNGKIFVRHDAQKTDAMQTNKNLLLSNEARVDTKPQLEILADDVKCAHGAAVGQIDEEELFYLQTRGLPPDVGRNLLTYGFAEEIVAKINFDSIKRQLNETVLNRLQAQFES